MHHNSSPLLQLSIFETSATALCGTTGTLFLFMFVVISIHIYIYTYIYIHIYIHTPDIWLHDQMLSWVTKSLITDLAEENHLQFFGERTLRDLCKGFKGRFMGIIWVYIIHTSSKKLTLQISIALDFLVDSFADPWMMKQRGFPVALALNQLSDSLLQATQYHLTSPTYQPPIWLAPAHPNAAPAKASHRWGRI